jgi:hypothetical protein
MKRAAKIICFLVLLGGAYWYADRVMQPRKEDLLRYRKFYGLKKNSLDVLYLGSSFSVCHINPAIVWQDRGILSYHLGTSEQPFWISYYNLVECLKYQDIKVLVLEVYASAWGWEYNNAVIYGGTYALKLSRNKINSIATATQPENFWDVFFGFPLSHSRRDLTKRDFTDPFKNKAYPNAYQKLLGIHVNERPKIDTFKDTLPLPLHDKEFTYLMKILDLTAEKNIPLLLFASPFATITEGVQGHYNTVKQIAAEYNNVQFINYNLLFDELEFNFAEDTHDGGHLNIKGAAKLSHHITNFLATEYGLPDRRQDPAYAEWNTWAEQVMAELPN